MSTILTRAGTYFDFLSPEKSRVDIDTIAHALAHICRYTGHTSSFYSVAQHSVLVSELVPPEHALAGLMHDAAEAYIGDVSAPLKSLLADYKAIEARVEPVILGHFGLQMPLPACVKHADNVARVTEQRDLMPPHERDRIDGITPDYRAIAPQQPYIARRMFLARFHELMLGSDRRQVRRVAPMAVDWSAA